MSELSLKSFRVELSGRLYGVLIASMINWITKVQKSDLGQVPLDTNNKSTYSDLRPRLLHQYKWMSHDHATYRVI